MKKYLLFTLLLLTFHISYAQKSWFYGMTSEGTDGGQGSIFKYSPSDPTEPILVHPFEVVAPGNTPDKVAFIERSDGQLWGTTGYGGKYNRGVLFSYNPKTNIYTVQHAFNGEDGSTVLSGVIEAKDNMLYGGTFRGGQGDSGVIYRFNPTNRTYTKLFDLAKYKIAGITDRLVQHSNGRIYGTTFVGGKGGSIFSFDPANPKKLDVEYLLDGTSAARPVGGLTEYKSQLYGVTRLGGTNRIGVMYKYDPADKSFTVLRQLDRQTGSVGVSAMTLYKDKLYGTLSNGGKANFGVLFSFDPNTQDYKVITYFPSPDTSANLGVLPLGQLHLTKDNKLIGVTSKGSKYRGGALFEYDPETNIVKQIGAFHPTEGYNPKSSPIKASDGKIYTITPTGGINSLGAIVVQEVNEPNHIPTNKLSLNNSPNGGSPCGTFIQASDGMMYGLARFGGSFGLGVALQLNPKTDKVKVLDEFDWINGARPLNDFTEYNGRLYCTTSIGGTEDRLGNEPGIGTVSSIDMKTFEIRKEAKFVVEMAKAPQGGIPFSKLVLTPDNLMYGTTQRGGDNDLGVIFKFDPAARTIKAVFSFDANSGYRPIGNMALGEDGWLYGMAQKGGKYNKGTIYKYNYKTDEFAVIQPFGGRISGRNPQSALLYKDGFLYGLSYEAGQKRMGTIFKYDLANDKFTRIASLDGIIGAFPYGGIAEGPDGNLYAFCSYGGTTNSGTSIRIDPETDEVELLFEFNRDLGAVPYFTIPGLYDPELATEKLEPNPTAISVFPNPVTTNLHIHAPASQIQKIDILTTSGTSVGPVRRIDNRLDVSNLRAGAYTVKVWLKNNKMPATAKFVKVK